MSTGQMTIGIITIVLAMIITLAGAVWVISEKINASHVELLEENIKIRVEIEKIRIEIEKIRVEIREENAKTRDELREEIGKFRVEFHKNMGELRGDIKKLETKLDEFRDFHEREHDLFYDQGGR